MGAEVVTLSLEQVGGEAGAAVAVVVGEGAAEGRSRDAVFGGEGDDFAPTVLGVLNRLVEVRVEEEVG